MRWWDSVAASSCLLLDHTQHSHPPSRSPHRSSGPRHRATQPPCVGLPSPHRATHAAVPGTKHPPRPHLQRRHPQPAPREIVGLIIIRTD
eukprot:COSAG01_NODE_1462_length_10236_cov_43.611226_5_plen_90_part_00